MVSRDPWWICVQQAFKSQTANCHCSKRGKQNKDFDVIIDIIKVSFILNLILYDFSVLVFKVIEVFFLM